MKRILYITIPVFAVAMSILSSCEKDITVGIPQTDKRPVIEGSIFQGQHPTVSITWSFPYFYPLNTIDINDPASLEQFLVMNAHVYVSDGIITDKLTLTIDQTVFPPVVYKGDSIIGEAGKTYTLTIDFPGYNLSAVTTIPYPIPLDSIGFKLDGTEDSLGYAYMYFQEPATVGNIYRLFSKRPSYERYVPTEAIGNSVLDDQAYNGQYIEFWFGRPRRYNSLFYNNDDTTMNNPDSKDRGYWRLGDTIMVRFCTIDRPSYDFIKTMENSAGTNGNPFSNPTTVKSNITGGDVLGGWVGYGVADIQAIAQ